MTEARAGLTRATLLPWAERQFGVSPAVGMSAFRTALLERLQRDDWLPEAEAQYAFETLSLRPEQARDMALAVGSGPFVFAAEKGLREEVEAFAAKFFDLTPAVRTDQWRALLERCRAYPALAHRLRHFERGLTVTIPTIGYKRAVLDLAQHLAELYVLRPRERAERRKFPNKRLENTVTQWRSAAVELKGALPDVAALEPKLIESLTSSGTRIRQAPPPRRSGALPHVKPSSAPLSTPLEDRRTSRTPRVAASFDGSNIPWRFLAVAVISFLSVASRSCGSKPYSSSYPSTYSQPSSQYSSPSGQSPDAMERAQKLYEELRGRNSTPQAPSPQYPSPYSNNPQIPTPGRPQPGVPYPGRQNYGAPSPYSPPGGYSPGRPYSPGGGGGGVPQPGGGGRMR